MATAKEKLKRQLNRLERAAEALEAEQDPVKRQSLKLSMMQRQKNILHLEGKIGRGLLHAQASRAGHAKASKGKGKDFYASAKWKQLRYQVLAASDRRCACCGSSPLTGAVLHVDHIRPRSTHPELALDANNLQVLCSDCNLGKMNFDATDFR